MDEQTRRERRNFWRWNAVVIGLVLMVGYEMLMGQMLWRQLKPVQSALQKQGITMEVQYKQMRGSKVMVKHALGQLEWKVSHQFWTPLITGGDLYRGKLKGEYRIGALHEKLNGTMNVYWSQNLGLELHSSGNAQLSPSKLNAYLPRDDAKRFAVKLKQGGAKWNGVTVAPWVAVWNVQGVEIPEFLVQRGAEQLQFYGMHFAAEKPVLTVEQVGQPAVFKALSIEAKVGDGVAQIALTGQALTVDNLPFTLILKQNVDRLVERLMQHSGGWLIYPMFVDGMLKGQASFDLNVGDKVLWAQGVANAKGIEANLVMNKALWGEAIMQHFQYDGHVWTGRLQFDLSRGEWRFVAE